MERLRTVFGLPPGGTLLIGPKGQFASLSLWVHWLTVSRRAAAAAGGCRPSDQTVDALSARVGGLDRELPDDPNRAGNEEMLHSMVAIAAAAHSIDGFYGAVAAQIQLRTSGARRNRKILEGLKHGFAIGQFAHEWLGELDWLFSVRDDIVHHGERLRPIVVSRTTAETIVLGGPESYNLSAEAARRAADFASTMIVECSARPKAMLREWAERAHELVSKTITPSGLDQPTPQPVVVEPPVGKASRFEPRYVPGRRFRDDPTGPERSADAADRMDAGLGG